MSSTKVKALACHLLCQSSSICRSQILFWTFTINTWFYFDLKLILSFEGLQHVCVGIFSRCVCWSLALIALRAPLPCPTTRYITAAARSCPLLPAPACSCPTLWPLCGTIRHVTFVCTERMYPPLDKLTDSVCRNALKKKKPASVT